jgi:hypothetical protein
VRPLALARHTLPTLPPALAGAMAAIVTGALALGSSIAYAQPGRPPPEPPAESADSTPSTRSASPPSSGEIDASSIEIATTPPEPKVSSDSAASLGEAPPVRPHHKGVVLATNLGMLAFAGQFRHVAPPAYWLNAQLGYEFFPWLMVFGEAELAFTDTSVSQDESHTVAVPMWGFGGGVRGTVHASPRVALFLQGEVGVLTALVPHDALAVLGYRSAESLNPDFGARLGAEWYQVDRHFALTMSAGARLAEGFSRVLTPGDLPLMWDASVGIRYTF